MVLFSSVTAKINQPTKCHYKGNILNYDFPFFTLAYGHPANFYCIWLKEWHLKIKHQTLKLSGTIKMFSTSHWKFILVKCKCFLLKKNYIVLIVCEVKNLISLIKVLVFSHAPVLTIATVTYANNYMCSMSLKSEYSGVFFALCWDFFF